jgi:hypothetical protein
MPRFPRTISLMRAGVTPSAPASAVEDKPIGLMNSSSIVKVGCEQGARDGAGA